MWRAIAVLLIATTAARGAAIDVVSLGPNDPSLGRELINREALAHVRF
jgi:hypothetical protein